MEVVQYGIDALSLGAVYALLALGIALIFGIMQLLNFAHGDLLMVGGYALFLFSGLAWPIKVALAVGIVVLFALALERVAFRPVRGESPATLLVTSFAVSYLLENLAILVFTARPKTTSIAGFLNASFSIGSKLQIGWLNVVTLAAALVLLVGLTFFLQRTPMGIQMRAAAEDFQMVRLLGVWSNNVIAMAFALSGVLAGVGGVLLVAQTSALTPDMGIAPVLVAFVATILGGMGSLLGAVLGGFLLGIATVVLDAALPFGTRPWRDAFVFGAVILVLLVRPQGLVASVAARTSRV